jgi:hypothetical protein
MQDPAYELRRMPLLGCWVNREGTGAVTNPIQFATAGNVQITEKMRHMGDAPLALLPRYFYGVM